MKKFCLILFSFFMVLGVVPVCACKKHEKTKIEEPVIEHVDLGCEFHNCSLDGFCRICENYCYLPNYKLVSICLDETEIKNCGIFYNEKYEKYMYKQIISIDIDMPIIDLVGDIFQATKENTVNILFSFDNGNVQISDIAGTAKVQGGSSAFYDKKNYNLKLDTKVNLVDEWGSQKKYCLKANYIDCSHSRNIVSANIYGQIVHSRNIEDEYEELLNGGAIDGVPVVVFDNGDFFGLCTLNIPKDKWLFGMKESDKKNHAILMADDYTNQTALQQTITDFEENGFDLEFYSNEKSKVDASNEWVMDGFNRLITFVSSSDDLTFKNEIGNYVDVQRVIDSMIFVYASGGFDNVSKNTLWVTYDGGNTWHCSLYDLDTTWGIYWTGFFDESPDSFTFPSLLERSNLLWKRVYTNFYDEFCDRYFELRGSVLSVQNIQKNFESFGKQISTIAIAAETEKWTEIPSRDLNNLEQIIEFASMHFDQMDSEILTKINLF